MKEVNWVNFFTVVVIDELLKHIQYFRLAQKRVEAKIKATSIQCRPRLSTNEDILSVEDQFFQLEEEREGICRDPRKEAGRVPVPFIVYLLCEETLARGDAFVNMLNERELRLCRLLPRCVGALSPVDTARG